MEEAECRHAFESAPSFGPQLVPEHRRNLAAPKPAYPANWHSRSSSAHKSSPTAARCHTKLRHTQTHTPTAFTRDTCPTPHQGQGAVATAGHHCSASHVQVTHGQVGLHHGPSFIFVAQFATAAGAVRLAPQPHAPTGTHASARPKRMRLNHDRAPPGSTASRVTQGTHTHTRAGGGPPEEGCQLWRVAGPGRSVMARCCSHTGDGPAPQKFCLRPGIDATGHRCNQQTHSQRLSTDPTTARHIYLANLQIA